MQSRLSLSSIVQRSPHLVASEVGSELVMMHVQQGRYYGLDRIGAAVWQRLQQATRVVDLCESLLADFDIDRETCQGDVLTLLEELRREQLLEVSPA